MTKTNKPSCLIVGAGMSGLMAANRLTELGILPVIIDKGRSVGGRMATRWIGPAIFDHGSQFFTVRTDTFQKYVDLWLESGLVREWCRGFENNPDGHPRYIGVKGMNSIAKHLAENLDPHVDQRILFLNQQEKKWQVLTDLEESFSADALILTPPVPQIVSLLQSGNMAEGEHLFHELDGIEYDRCLALLAVVEGTAPFAPPGAIQLSGEPITWIADNQVKGVSPSGPAITMHAGPDFSRKYWEMEDKTIVQNLMYIASDWVKARFVEYQVKRWRFSQPRIVHEQRTVFFDDPLPIAFAGDAFGGPRLEGAALSGLSAAEAIAGFFNR